MSHRSAKQQKIFRQSCQTRVNGRVCDALNNPSKASLRDLLKDAAANTASIKPDDDTRTA